MLLLFIINCSLTTFIVASISLSLLLPFCSSCHVLTLVADSERWASGCVITMATVQNFQSIPKLKQEVHTRPCLSGAALTVDG